MSRVKFRIWDKRDEDPIMTDDDGHFFVSAKGDVFCVNENIEISELVVLMQWTGLKDKNGQEIYEGDLIRFNGVKKNNIFEVIYGRCSFEFIRESGSIYRADQLLWSDVEVVSNIFETGKSRKLDILYDDHPNGGPKFPF